MPPDAFTERKLAEAFASHPALAAEVVAEARAVRRRHEAEARAAAEAAAAAKEAATAKEAEVPGEWRRGGGATLAEMAEQAGRQAAAAAGEGDEGYGDNASRPLRRMQQRARSMRQPPLLVDTLEVPSAAALMWEDDEAEARAAVEEATGGGEGSLAPRANAGLARMLWLDLHGMSQAAARMSVLRRLEVLVSVGPALSAAVGTWREQSGGSGGPVQQRQQQAREQGWQWRQGRQAVGGSGGSSGNDDNELLEEQQAPPSGAQPPVGQAARQRQRQQQRRPWEEGLVVVTGVGRHSRADAPGVLRQAVSQLLAAQGLPAAPDPSNAGRLLVPWPALAAFIAAQRERMRRDHLFAVMRARVLYVVAGVAGLVSAAVLVPRLAPWLG